MLSRFFRSSRNLFITGGVLFVAMFILIFFLLSSSQRSPVASANQPFQVGGIGGNGVVAPQLVATKNIPPMTQFTDIGSAMQYFTEKPVNGYVDPTYVHGKDGLASLLAAGTRHNSIPLQRGSTLLTTEIMTNTVAIDYAPLLKQGEVAQTIVLQPEFADNGVIQPSDHVNLLLSLKMNVTYRDLLSHRFKTFFQTNTSITPQTPKDTVIGYIYETQTTMENLRVLGVTGNNYTVAMSNQDALLYKFIKDNGDSGARYVVADMVVRSSNDTDGKHQYFQTSTLTGDNLFDGKYTRKNAFYLP